LVEGEDDQRSPGVNLVVEEVSIESAPRVIDDESIDRHVVYVGLACLLGAEFFVWFHGSLRIIYQACIGVCQ
jgi:hypothetical protein